ncbi:uncharacterized protein LOC126678024 isoform X2 [Mercurialis annua]|uniref:uncharacterized protein LOC126678024 isoform X2 n=1 Tax=Mercurialis annua TaxID=3986 RepID=UPI00215EFD45|nr:uncharacterized protein LOC126678024 isoform X2 [Mercurialis annua]
MDATTSTAADLSTEWLWAIEYLSCFPQIHPSTLHDLIDEAPELPEDLGKNARERLSLKCLEHLFTAHNTDAPASDAPSSSNLIPRVTVDLSDSCENVLRSVEDIRHFIFQKRASMPICALQQLKDAILEGTNPHASSLRDFSGLVHANDDNYEINVDSEAVRNGTDIQNMAPEGCNIHFPIVSGDYHQKNLLPLKRNGNILDNEQSVEDNQEDQGGVSDRDLHLDAKRFKNDANKSGEQTLVPQFGNELAENSSELIIRVAKRDNCHVEPIVQVGLGECCSLEHGREQSVAIDGFECSADVNDDFQQKQCDNVNNANRKLECISGGGARQCILEDEVNGAEYGASNVAFSLKNPQNISRDKNKDNLDTVNQFNSLNVLPTVTIAEILENRLKNRCQEDSSSESGRFNHEKIDVAMEKSHFLSSHCTLSHVSPSNWTELKLCVKCSKDDQLLICNAISCPFTVHEKCLGCSPEFDKNGNFYCPFCAYAYAISKYHEARGKATLARKELAVFVCGHPKRSHTRKRCSLEHNREVGTLHKMHETGDLGKRKSDQTNNKVREYVVSGQLMEKIGHKQSEEPILSCDDVKVKFRKDPGKTHGINHNSPEVNGSKETDLECQPGRGLDRRDQRCHGDHPISEDKEVFSSNKSEAERGIKDVLEQQSTMLVKTPGCYVSFDGGETSANEDVENVMPNFSISLRRREMREGQYLYPTIPQLKRKRIPWTAEEEKILKEGVQKISKIGSPTIPWTDILEYGRLVFSDARTTIDLKDKWRNICKASSKCK